MVQEPVVTAVASPLELTVATPLLLEAQFTWLVVLPSENVAVATNCAVVCCPKERLMVALVGLMVMDWTVLLLTVRVTPVALTLLVDFALMVVVPSATPVASPELSMVAMVGDEEVQVTSEVTSPVLLLPKVAVALNCWVAFGMTKAPVGDIASETIVLDPGKKPGQPYQPLNRVASGSATANLQTFENPVLDTIPAPIPGAPKLIFFRHSTPRNTAALF